MSCLKIDEKTNIIDSFEKAESFLVDRKSELDLKWFVISFHHAVYCLMLYALTDSACGGVWQKSLVTHEDGTVDITSKKNQLLDFMKAFEYIQDVTKMRHCVHSKPFIANSCHKNSMLCLNRTLRNGLVHYRPMSWNISEEYIYKTCKPIVEIVESLVFDNGQCHLLFVFDEENNNKLRKIIDSIKKYFDFSLEN